MLDKPLQVDRYFLDLNSSTSKTKTLVYTWKKRSGFLLRKPTSLLWGDFYHKKTPKKNTQTQQQKSKKTKRTNSKKKNMSLNLNSWPKLCLVIFVCASLLFFSEIKRPKGRVYITCSRIFSPSSCENQGLTEMLVVGSSAVPFVKPGIPTFDSEGPTTNKFSPCLQLEQGFPWWRMFWKSTSHISRGKWMKYGYLAFQPRFARIYGCFRK